MLRYSYNQHDNPNMSKLTSYTYDQLEVGTEGRFSKTVTDREVTLFGATSGDINPVHFDAEYAATTRFEQRIAHGMWSAGLISTVIGIVMPGPGSIYVGQSLRFRRPVHIGDTLAAILTVKEKIDKKKFVVLDCQVVNQDGEVVTLGEATVMPPQETVEADAPVLPGIRVEGLD